MPHNSITKTTHPCAQLPNLVILSGTYVHTVWLHIKGAECCATTVLGKPSSRHHCLMNNGCDGSTVTAADCMCTAACHYCNQPATTIVVTVCGSSWVHPGLPVLLVALVRSVHCSLPVCRPPPPPPRPHSQEEQCWLCDELQCHTQPLALTTTDAFHQWGAHNHITHMQQPHV